MAIIRRKHFPQTGNIKSDDISLIDTPEKLLKFAELKGLNNCPLDVEAVAQKFNICIKYVSMEEDLSGILSKDESDAWTLNVNEEHHPNRQRYTIAHELGHYCLHGHLKKEFKDKIFFRGGEANKMEWQANNFASAILMPEDKFREKIQSGVNKVDELAKQFQVSTLALRIRAKNLGISGHGL